MKKERKESQNDSSYRRVKKKTNKMCNQTLFYPPFVDCILKEIIKKKTNGVDPRFLEVGIGIEMKEWFYGNWITYSFGLLQSVYKAR